MPEKINKMPEFFIFPRKKFFPIFWGSPVSYAYGISCVVLAPALSFTECY